MTCTQAFKQHTNENWRTSRMQWEIVILLHSRRRSKKQQAVGPVGSRGSKLDKTTPTVEKFQGRRELQFLWDGWFKKAILLSVMECRNPYRFRMFVFVGLQLPAWFWDICLKLRQHFKQGSQKTVPTSMTGFRPCVSVLGVPVSNWVITVCWR